MKLHLKHFRCHVTGEFELPDEGMVLLTGASGAGKTTILNALVYVLYGQIRKPYSHGKTTCQVKLEGLAPQVCITRTSHPNRLVVVRNGKTFEDDAAQGVIDDVLKMTYPEFAASSYIMQRLDSSVLSMTPSEQVQFVETLAFSDNVHVATKRKIRDYVKEKNDTVQRLTGEARVLEKQCDDRATADEEEDIPDPQTVRDEHARLQAAIDEAQKGLEEHSETLIALRAAEEEHRKVEAQRKQITIEKAQLQRLKADLAAEMSSEEIERLEADLEALKKKRDQNAAYLRATEESERLERLKAGHVAALRERLEALGEIDEAEYETLRQQVADAQTGQTLAREYDIQAAKKADAKERVKQLFRAIKEVENSVDIVDAKTGKAMLSALRDLQIARMEEIDHILYECPACEASLYMSDGELRIANPSSKKATPEGERETLSASIERIRTWIELLEEWVPVMNVQLPEPVHYDVDELLSSSARLIEMERTRNEVADIGTALKEGTFPTAIVVLQESVDALRLSVPHPFEPEDVDALYAEKQAEVSEAWRVKSEHSSYDRELRNKDKQLRKLPKPKRVEQDSLSVEHEINEYQRQLVEHTRAMTQCQRQLQIVQRVEELQRLKEERDRTQLSLTAEEAKLRGAHGLEEASRQAEVLAIERTIQSINEHAQVYLSEMFGDDIVVRLESFKRGGDKPTMNVSVAYKGGEYAGVDELSGGERQRCNLAFILAVNDMLGSPLLLLDECINNLDAEVHADVLEILKRSCQGKLVLVVSHEAVHGVFDEVIEVT